MKEKIYNFLGTNIVLRKGKYPNGVLAVAAYEVDTDELFFVLTVNIVRYAFMCTGNASFLDINRARTCSFDIKKWVLENDIAYVPGICVESGFVSDYPLALFKDDVISEMQEIQ